MAEVNHFDVIINGAGVAGLTLALALVEKSLRIAVVDPRGLIEEIDASIGARVRALNHTSVNILKNLNVWQHMPTDRLGYFDDVNVWNNSGEVSYSSSSIGKKFLGVCVEEKVLLKTLSDRVKNEKNISVFKTKARSMKNFQHDAHFILESGEQLAGKLLVAADGAQSWLRSRANIELETVDYGQTAIVATVTTEKPHRQCARQRFLSTGPLVFLPLAEKNTSSIVWSLTHDLAKEYIAAGDNTFKALLQQAFQSRLEGIESISQRFSFPLMQRMAKSFYTRNIVLVSDAAHTMHPLAGLGLNVGLMDVAWLTQIIEQALQEHIAVGDPNLLARYQRARIFQIQKMQKIMMAFKSLFSNDKATLSWLRNVGMQLTDNQQWLKNLIILDACHLEMSKPTLAQ